MHYREENQNESAGWCCDERNGFSLDKEREIVMRDGMNEIDMTNSVMNMEAVYLVNVIESVNVSVGVGDNWEWLEIGSPGGGGGGCNDVIEN